MIRRHLLRSFPGAIHFVTTVTCVRGNVFTQPHQCETLLRIFEDYRARTRVTCLGYVLMPDHFHALLYQEDEEPSIPALMQDFKKLTSRRCRPPDYPEPVFWRRRYDDVPVPGPRAIGNKLRYIHENPVRRGLVERPEEYPWSSAGDYFLDQPGLVTVTFFRVD